MFITYFFSVQNQKCSICFLGLVHYFKVFQINRNKAQHTKFYILTVCIFNCSFLSFLFLFFLILLVSSQIFSMQKLLVFLLSSVALCFLLFFLFFFQVKDQEFPYYRDLARIIVTLEDANDQPPFFTCTMYDSTVFESAPPGTSALQVIALDRDSGRNGEIVYSIDAGKHHVLCS